MAVNSSPRAKRWRRVVWFALLAVLLCVGAAFVYHFYHGRDKRYYSRGQVYLEYGDTNKALQQFRAALKLNPKLLEAQVGIIRALVLRKEFAEALEEVNHAAKNGLAESEAALLKAKVFSARANYRFETAGTALTAENCEQAATEDVDPAIALVQQQAEKTEKPAAAYALLGDLLHQKLGIEKAEQGLLIKAYRKARDFDKKDEMAAREQDVRALLLKMRSVRGLADQAYEEAIKKDPNAAEPRIALAQEALQAYTPRTVQAKAILEPLMKLTPPPREALYLTAVAEWCAGDPDRAVEHLRLLNNVKVPRREYLITEAEILISRGRWPEVRAVAEKFQKADSKRPEVSWIMGRLLLHEGHADEALALLQNIFAEARTWAQARLSLAQALMSATPPKREQAVSEYSKVLDDCKVTTPANVRVERELREAAYQACIALAGATKELGPKAAQEYAVRALGLAPERTEAFQLAHDMCKAAGVAPERIEALALFHARAMMRDPARRKAVEEFLQKEYEEFKDTRGKAAPIRLLRANLLQTMGSYVDAVAVYEELRKEFPKATLATDELAQLQVQLGHYKEAREVYESAVAANPDDMRAVAGLVGVLVRMKDMAAAHAVLDRATGAANSERVWAMTLQIFLREKRLDEAVSLAKSYVEKNPGSAAAQCMAAELLWQQGDLKGAKSAFDAALKLAPAFAPAHRRALLDVEENRAADAVTLLRPLAETSHTVSAKADLAVALQADGKLQEAADILKDLSASAHGPLAQLDSPRWLLAVLLAGEGDLEGAGEMSALLAPRDFIGLPADRLQFLQRLAATPEPPLRAGVAATREPGRRALAAKANVVVWLRMNPCPGALEQADFLVKQLPDEPLAACWRVRLLDAAGKYDEAAQQCRDILSKHPGFVIARLLLAQNQQRNGKTEEAIQSLDEAINAAPPDQVAVIQLQRAKLLADSGRLDEAIAGFQAITSPPALAAAASNELAWLYVTRRNDPDSALPHAEQAAQLSPNDPAILDTLGWVLYMKGENGKALEILQKAKSGLPKNPTLRYHLGLALLKSGQKAEAKTEFAEALAISSDFPEAADAAAQLAGI